MTASTTPPRGARMTGRQLEALRPGARWRLKLAANWILHRVGAVAVIVTLPAERGEYLTVGYLWETPPATRGVTEVGRWLAHWEPIL